MRLDKFVEPVFLAAGGSVRSESKLKSVGDGEVVLTTSFGVDITASFYGRVGFLFANLRIRIAWGYFRLGISAKPGVYRAPTQGLLGERETRNVRGFWRPLRGGADV